MERTNKEQFEPQPQNFAHLLLMCKNRAFQCMQKGNYTGFINIVKLFQQMMIPIYDEMFKEDFEKINNKYQEIFNTHDFHIRGFNQQAMTGWKEGLSFEEQKKAQAMLDYHMKLFGLLSELEGRAGLLLEQNIMLEEE